jgi:hypothetical protein
VPGFESRQSSPTVARRARCARKGAKHHDHDNEDWRRQRHSNRVVFQLPLLNDLTAVPRRGISGRAVPSRYGSSTKPTTPVTPGAAPPGDGLRLENDFASPGRILGLFEEREHVFQRLAIEAGHQVNRWWDAAGASSTCLQPSRTVGSATSRRSYPPPSFVGRTSPDHPAPLTPFRSLACACRCGPCSLSQRTTAENRCQLSCHRGSVARNTTDNVASLLPTLLWHLRCTSRLTGARESRPSRPVDANAGVMRHGRSDEGNRTT